MNPRFPLYIVSKGRADSRLTAKSLERMKVPYFVVIEEQEYSTYAAVIDRKKLVILDKAYQRNYDAFDHLGDTKSKGPGPARNFAWDHSISLGHEWHWVMDDNITDFYRLNNNVRIRLHCGSGFYAMETFCLRFANVAMAGPNYRMFAAPRTALPPYSLNTRIYSCNLIRNDVPHRWRGRYNEDTDISLRMLKAGWCTVQFYAFLQDKLHTQVLKGGNTAEFYAKEGTLPKSMMQVAMHPDVSRIVQRYGRWHHHVDYSPFKKNKLILKPDVVIPHGVDELGMKLVRQPKP